MEAHSCSVALGAFWYISREIFFIGKDGNSFAAGLLDAIKEKKLYKNLQCSAQKEWPHKALPPKVETTTTGTRAELLKRKKAASN
jgi:hypothetical protein